MNKEEAIEILKSPLLKSDGYERHQKAIDTILNLMEKQEKEKIISDLYIEIQIAKNTLNHNKLFSKDEELVLYNEEHLELLQGIRDLIDKQQKEIEKLEDITRANNNSLKGVMTYQ